MITIFSRITVTLVELPSITIAADNLKKKLVRDPLFSVRILKMTFRMDQYQINIWNWMTINSKYKKNHRIMKSKSFRFILFHDDVESMFIDVLIRWSKIWRIEIEKYSRDFYGTQKLNDVSDEHLPDDWSWDRNRIKNLPDDWFWDRDHKKKVFFIIVWKSRLYLSVIFRNLLPFDLRSWSSKNRSIIHWFWKNTQDELIIFRNSWRHSSVVMISSIKDVVKNANQMLLECDLDLENKIMNWLKFINNLHYWIFYRCIKELCKWRSMIFKNEWDFFYNYDRCKKRFIISSLRKKTHFIFVLYKYIFFTYVFWI